jgi:uncharacterized protein (DUF952 family)
MDWGTYLARGVSPIVKHRIIYHMTERNSYENQIQTSGVYFPPTFNQDKFIHATADANFLLGVGNNFYKDNIGDWICLEIDVNLLKSPVIYEPRKS